MRNVALALLVVGMLVPRSSRAAPSITQVTGFGSNPGALEMFEHAPAGLAPNKPVVVVLHGCTESAASAAATGWNDLADQLGFLVVYPQQTTANNPVRCFNWAGEYGNPENLQRGKGENLSIKQMVDKAVADHGSDPKRVFVVGFSAGGGTAAIMAATYPDVFAGAAIIAGIPFNCTTTYSEVNSCMKPGKDKTPQEWGDKVRAAQSGFTGPWPRVSVWQGDADTIVGTMNRTELVEQWTNVHGLAATPSASDTVDGQAHSVFEDASGKAVVETYVVSGMGHGVPVSGAGCGTPGTYAIDKGICAAKHIAEFFEIGGAPAPGTDAGASSSSSSASSASGGATSGGTASSSGGAGASPGEEDPSYDSTCSFGLAPIASRAPWGAVIVLFAMSVLRRTKKGRSR